MLTTSCIDPLALRPADEVAGWRLLHRWRQDSFSVTWGVERAGERRLLRLALRPPDSPESREMEQALEREAGALRRVQHPNIIRLHEDGRWPEPGHGLRYLLLEYVADVNLQVARAHGMTARDVVRIFSQLASAVDAMRHVGINHGAIGPKNILLRENGEPVLVDFTSAHWPGNPHPPEYRPLAGFEGFEELFPRSHTDPSFRMPVIRGKGKNYRS